MSIAPTERRARGLSLPEVLVASAIFALMAIMLVATERFCRRAAGKSDVHSDTYRMVMVTLDHIRAELQPSRLVSVEPDHVDYKLPRMLDGELKTDGLSGTPLWWPGGSESHSLSLRSDGRVIAVRLKTSGDTWEQKLGDLGPRGSLEFSRPLMKLLYVKAHAEIVDPGGRRQESIYDGELKIYIAGET